MAGRLRLRGPPQHPRWRAGMLRGSSVSLSDAFGVHATPGSSRPHPARLRPAPLLPRARLAFRGCWLQRAFSCRGLRPIRSLFSGSNRMPHRGNLARSFRVSSAWEFSSGIAPSRLLGASPCSSIRTGSLPAYGLARSAGRPAGQPPWWRCCCGDSCACGNNAFILLM